MNVPFHSCSFGFFREGSQSHEIAKTSSSLANYKKQLNTTKPWHLHIMETKKRSATTMMVM